jgi:translation initiation factor IF-2
MRVHILAKELNVPSKVIIEKCQAEGISAVKNHMSTLSAGLHATILEWFSDEQHDTAVETAKPIELAKVQLKSRRRKAAGAPSTTRGESDDTGIAVSEPEADEAGELTLETEPSKERAGSGVAAAKSMPEQAPAPVEEVDATAVVGESASEAIAEAPRDQAAAEAPIDSGAEAAEAGLASTDADDGSAAKSAVSPAGPQNVPQKAKLQGPRVVRYEAMEQGVGIRGRRGPRRPEGAPGTEAAGIPVVPPADATRAATDDKAAKRKGRVNPRRAAGRMAEAGEKLLEWRDRDLAERKERLAGATGRRIRRRSTHSGGGTALAPAQRTEAIVSEPIMMKEFLGATGLNFIECFKILRDEHSIVGNVNMILPTETAELLALDFGIELRVIPAKTKLDEVQEEFAGRERKNLQSRPPVVAMLGHVDHGKTSLLDAIRRTRVAAQEDGGITQHIGAYHIESERGPVTFLDTPGHQAFTAMRARGAHLTDVVVLVIAADDGVMPQTVEAINHAKAAKVSIVVALNKIDLGEQNKLKIYGQLAEHELSPGEWGGEIDVIATSATTGVGVRELVEHLADLSSVLDLKADPKVPAMGTVIEAETQSGVGAVARVLVQEGTLRVGEFVVCGPGSGKVRALVDDRGRRVEQAGPSMAIEVWGLDEVPASGDRLYAVGSMQRANDIAAETRQKRVEAARIQTRRPRSLEDMLERRGDRDVAELNVVIKADVDGSVAAIQKSLEDIPSTEVKLTIRHAGVGAVNDGDVLLAATSDGLVLAFRVDVPAMVRRVAEQHNVDVRSYRVIYEVVDDIRKALEGLLAPEEIIEFRGSAEVREIFRLGKKIGAIAGCFVRDGVIERSHFAKVIRNGVVVRDKCRFGSLRRFKDDAREVRAGFECGIKLEGFDDVHVGDTIETFEIIQKARTL